MLFSLPNHSAFKLGCANHKTKAFCFLLQVLLLCSIGTSSSFPASLSSSRLAAMGKITEASPLISNGSKASEKEGDIHSYLANMRNLMQEMHDSRVNFSYAWRIDQLTRLENMVKEHWEEILDALNQDLGKVRVVAACFEMGSFGAEVDYFKSNLKSLMKPQHKTSLVHMAPAFSKLTPLPRNGPAVLVIGPSNYPISISLMAVAGSLASGNPTVLKPSELCPASAALLAKYVPLYFDSSAFQVVKGGVPETTALLELEWGMIHFTGSERVGKVSTC
jgi:acyl-CoA reductase-like NAD-dependent aldehyde dehydrogenase